MVWTMELYFCQNSGNSARVVFALIESCTEWKPYLLDPKTGDTRSSAYLKINPMGKVPALISGEFVLWESNAINWYIAQKKPDAGLLPETLEGQVSVMRWQHFQSAHVTPAAAPIIRLNNPRMAQAWGVKGDPQAAAAASTELARYLTVLETRLTNQSWLEEHYSLADIAYAPHLWLLNEGGFDFGAFPAVRAWLDRLLNRVAWQRTVETVFP